MATMSIKVGSALAEFIIAHRAEMTESYKRYLKGKHHGNGG